jgi:hypothetical protein
MLYIVKTVPLLSIYDKGISDNKIKEIIESEINNTELPT